MKRVSGALLSRHRPVALRRCALGLLTVGLVAATAARLHGGEDNESDIRRGAVAPFVAVAHRQASALCSDFTASAASHLAESYSGSTSCEVRVHAAFALGLATSSRVPDVSHEVTVSDITARGERATVALEFRAAPNIVRKIALEYVGQRWLVSTPPVLAVVEACHWRSAVRVCGRVVALAVATATAGPVSP